MFIDSGLLYLPWGSFLEHLKEDAWNLELAKQELGNTMAELQHSLSKSATDQNKMSKQLTTLTQEVEVLRSTEEKLTTQVETMKTRHEQDMNAMRKHSSSLQREKGDITKQLETTVAELAAVRNLSKSNRKSISDADNLGSSDGANINGSGDDANGKQHGHSPNASPPPSPTHAPRNHALELETLKTSLGHAHRMISNLRSSLHKEKQDRFELKKHLADSQETIEQLRNGSHMWADVGADRAGGSGSGAGEGAAGSNAASGRRLKKAGNKKRTPARRAKGLTPRRPSDDDEEYEDVDDMEIHASENSEDDYENDSDKLQRRHFASSGKSHGGDLQQWEDGQSETSDSDSVDTVDEKSPLGISQANFVPLSSELSGSKGYHAGIDMGVNTDPVVLVSDNLPVEQPKVIQVDIGVNTDEYKPSSDFSAAAAMVAGGLAGYTLGEHDKAKVSAPTQLSSQPSEQPSIVKSAESPTAASDNVTPSAGVQNEIANPVAAVVSPIVSSNDSSVPTQSTASEMEIHTPSATEIEKADAFDQNVDAKSEISSKVLLDDSAAAQSQEAQSAASLLPIALDKTNVAAQAEESKTKELARDVCANDNDNPVVSSKGVPDEHIAAKPEEAQSATSPLPSTNVEANVAAQSQDQRLEEKINDVPNADVSSPTASADVSISEVAVAAALAGGITGATIARQVTESKSFSADATNNNFASTATAVIPTTDTASVGDFSGAAPIADQVAESKSVPTDTVTGSAATELGTDNALAHADEVPPAKTLSSDAATSGALADRSENHTATIQKMGTISAAVPHAVTPSASLTAQGAAATKPARTISYTDVQQEEAQHQELPTEEVKNNVAPSDEKSTTAPAEDSVKLVEIAALTGGVASIGLAEKMAENHSLSAHTIDETPVEVIESPSGASPAVHPYAPVKNPNQAQQYQDRGHAKICTQIHPTTRLTQKNLQALSASPDTKDVAQEREFDSISRSDVESRRASSSIYKPMSEKEGFSSMMAPNIVSNITQTMIGNWMWKSTRKAVGSGFSDNRHRRFFWIHPYSRTLYWSMKEPGSNGEAKAKSALIESITTVEERSISPPGLPSVSLLLKTSNREIKFTALDAAQHEMWLQSINYLLSRPSNGLLQPKKEPQSMRSNPSLLLKKPSFQRIQSVFSSSASNAPSKPDSARYGGEGMNDEDLEDLEDVRMCCDGKHHISKLEKTHPHRSSKQYRPVSGTSFDQPFAMSIASGNGSTHYDH